MRNLFVVASGRVGDAGNSDGGDDGLVAVRAARPFSGLSELNAAPCQYVANLALIRRRSTSFLIEQLTVDRWRDEASLLASLGRRWLPEERLARFLVEEVLERLRSWRDDRR